MNGLLRGLPRWSSPVVDARPIDLNGLAGFDLEAATVGYWMNHPHHGGVNHDNNPVSLTASEFMARQGAFAPFYPEQVARLAALFGRAQGPIRTERNSATGARIGAYDEASFGSAERVLTQLAKNPKIAAILPQAAVVVSPPGRGLDALEGVPPMFHDAEGVAFSKHHLGGFPVPLSEPRAEGVVIQHSSLMRWDMGLVHELLHLLQFDLPADKIAKIEAVYADVVGPTAQNDPSLDPGHLFVYLGQYYLSGYPEIVRDVAPKVYVLCQELIGQPPAPSRPADVQALHAAAQHIYDRYTS